MRSCQKIWRDPHPGLLTISNTGKLVFHVFAALAEFERNLIRERTLTGLNAARARGRRGHRHYDTQGLSVE
jgi:DNA invertase Pin-like site-specific DNA recombinase